LSQQPTNPSRQRHRYITVNHLNGDMQISFSPAITEGLQFAKILHSLVQIDLGSTNVPNLLLDEDGIQYALNAPDDMNRQPGGMLFVTDAASFQYFAQIPWPNGTGTLLPNASYDAISPLMGKLGTTKTTIFVRYICSILEQKSTGTMLLAILIADLVFLQAAWKIFKWVAETILERRDPGAMVCDGCLKGRSLAVGMDNLGGRTTGSGYRKMGRDTEGTESLIDR
jgi:hypothetical protein